MNANFEFTFKPPYAIPSLGEQGQLCSSFGYMAQLERSMAASYADRRGASTISMARVPVNGHSPATYTQVHRSKKRMQN
jgi:hypothetical protein